MKMCTSIPTLCNGVFCYFQNRPNSTLTKLMTRLNNKIKMFRTYAIAVVVLTITIPVPDLVFVCTEIVHIQMMFTFIRAFVRTLKPSNMLV